MSDTAPSAQSAVAPTPQQHPYRPWCDCGFCKAIGDSGEVLKMLDTATVRIEILMGRMRACYAHEQRAVHELSIFEAESWVAEQRAVIGRAALESPHV